jgi:hypothetical protein
MLVAVQLSVLGLYRPPLFNLQLLQQPIPPQMIISLPVHTAVCDSRASGALTVLVGVQLSAVGLYRPPLSKSQVKLYPPQTITSLPVHTAV